MIVDLFAGPGGWSEGLRMLGHREVGIEWDEPACLTARAAGHDRIQADVAALNPTDIFASVRTGRPLNVDGLIASPPCQAWSMAGKGGGRRDVEHVIACALELAAGNDTRAEHAAKCEDERSMLVVEPLRWALALKPTWIALEQVPPVLELWSLFAQLLEAHGWNTWAGVLEAERYGVPQTRERAVLMAHRDRPVQPPVATHQRYVPGEPQRHDITLEGEVLPWVSMAEALGWGMTERPGLTFAPGTGNGGAAYEGGSGARASMRRERERGAWAMQTGNFTAIARDADGKRSKAGSVPYQRPASEPSPVVATSPGEWVHDRPATAVCGDPRVFPPGGHMANDGRDNSKMVGRSEGTIRVTVEEAAVLQSFRPDYPWQGSRSKQFQQVGNAVPPLLAKAVLGELVPPADEMEAAA